MVDAQGTKLRLAVGDCDMSGTVVAHQNHIVDEVVGVVLRERTSTAQTIENLHCLHILDLKLARDRDSASGKQAVSDDDGAQGVFVVGNADALVVVRERA